MRTSLATHSSKRQTYLTMASLNLLSSIRPLRTTMAGGAHRQVVPGVARAQRVRGGRAVPRIAAQHDAVRAPAQRARAAPALGAQCAHALHHRAAGPRPHRDVRRPQRAHLA